MTTTATGTQLAQFGVIGLGVMGENLALNVEEHGFRVAVWNLEPEWTDRFVQKNSSKQVVGTKTLADFVKSIARPRAMLMMIKAGDPGDIALDKRGPLSEPGEHVIRG